MIKYLIFTNNKETFIHWDLNIFPKDICRWVGEPYDLLWKKKHILLLLKGWREYNNYNWIHEIKNSIKWNGCQVSGDWFQITGSEAKLFRNASFYNKNGYYEKEQISKFEFLDLDE